MCTDHDCRHIVKSINTSGTIILCNDFIILAHNFNLVKCKYRSSWFLILQLRCKIRLLLHVSYCVQGKVKILEFNLCVLYFCVVTFICSCNLVSKYNLQFPMCEFLQLTIMKKKKLLRKQSFVDEIECSARKHLKVR